MDTRCQFVYLSVQYRIWEILFYSLQQLQYVYKKKVVHITLDNKYYVEFLRTKEKLKLMPIIQICDLNLRINTTLEDFIKWNNMKQWSNFIYKIALFKFS